MSRPGSAIAIAAIATAGLAAPASAGPGDREVAAAEPEDDAPSEPRLIPAAPAPREPEPREWTGHRHQLGVGLQVGAGLRGIKPYDDLYCGERGTDGAADAPVCVGRQPLGVDIQLTWGASAGVELLVEGRLGLERDFGAAAGDLGPRPLRLAPGARFFFAESGRTSFFSTLQAVVDFTDYRDPSGASRGTDVGARNVNGLLLDLDPAYGLYVFLGETAAFRRWIAAELELGLGIQGRYP